MRPVSSFRRVPRGIHLAVLAAALSGGSLACGNDTTGPSGPQPDHIELSATSLTLRQRESVQIVPSVVDKNGTLISGVGVKFRSSDTTVVTVSNVGVVNASGRAGTAVVTATADRVHADIPVTVTAVSNGIIVTPSPAIVLQKGTLALSARVVDVIGATIPGAVISYSTSNAAVVTVSPSGVITSTGPAGAAVVTLISDTLSATVPVSVPQVPTTLSAPSTLSLARSTSGAIGARLFDAVGTVIPNAQFTYSSDNTGIVGVGTDGILHSGGSLGSANITVRSGSLSATVRVSVVNAGHPLEGSVAASSPVTGSAWAVAISSGGVVYAGEGDLSRADLPSFTMTQVVAGTGNLLLDVVFNASGTTAYVSGLTGNQLTAIDVARNTVLWTVPVAGTAFAVALSPDEQTVYISTGNGTLYAIDVASRSVKATLTLGGAPNHLAVNRATGKLYVNDYYGSRVSEIDMSTNTLVRTLSLTGKTPQMMAVSPDGGTLYVANESGSILYIDLATGTKVAETTLPSGAFGLALSPDGLQLYASTGYSSTVIVVDVQSKAVVNTIPVNGDARRVAFSPDGMTAAVASGGSVTFIR